ncbi:MAG: response regulator, partial [Marinovum sp.]|nr:response regulator [Marinovum sp.]
MKILIADDHGLLRDTLVLFVEGEGSIEIVTASNLDEALAIVDAQGPFDLIMLDYNMPGMSGLDGLKRALTYNGDQKVAL